MNFLTNFSDKVYAARVVLIAALLLAGCATGKRPAMQDPSSPKQRLIAVLPVENKGGESAHLDEIRAALIAGLRGSGAAVLDDGSLEQFRTKHRMRYTGGLDAATSAAFKSDLGVDAVLITTLDLYSEFAPPRISLLARLVGTGTNPSLLWLDSVGMTGDDSPGLLGLGRIEDPVKLQEKAVQQLSASLAAHLAGKDRGDDVRSTFQPKSAFRSPAVGRDLRESFVSFVETRSRGDESEGAVRLEVALSSASGAPVEVRFAATGGNAAEGRDYKLKGGTLIIPPGETRAFIELVIMKTGLAGDDKTVEISLKGVKNSALGSTTSHIHTILITTPPPSAGFARAEQSLRENAGAAALTIELSAASSQDVIVPFTVSGTAATPFNYTISKSPLVIKAGARSGSIVVQATDNGTNEDDKTVVVTMGVPEHAVQGKITQSTLTIVDVNAAPVVSFALRESRGEDARSPARIEVRLSAESGKTVTVEYGTAGGTARRGVEYAAGGGALRFLPGEQSKFIELEKKYNGIHDENRTVELALTKAVNGVLAADARHTHTIVNTAPMPVVEFLHPRSGGYETERTARLEVTLNPASNKPATISFAAAGGTAAAGINYELKDGAVTFAPGERFKTIELGIRDDRVNRADTTVAVSLKSPVNAVLGSTPTHTFTIIDRNPEPAVSFAMDALQRQESGGRAAITAELTTPSGKDVIVPFTVSGTAKTPGNYTITASPLVIRAGEKSASIIVSPADNGINEDDKTVVVTMGVPVNAGQGELTHSTLTITDADPLPTALFAQKESRGDDRESPARIEVRLSGASGRPVTVEYVIDGGTAAPGKDVAPARGTLIFPPGETVKFLELGIRRNGVSGEDKTVEVRLTKAVNCSLGAQTQHRYVIVNAHPAPSAAFAVSSQRFKKSVGRVNVTVELSEASGKDIEVPFIVGGTADPARDFSLSASPLVIKAGSKNADITVTLKRDAPVESDRTLELRLGAPKNAHLGSIAVYSLALAKDTPPTIAIVPFLNVSKKKAAGELVMLQFVKELAKLENFTVIEPGMVRQQLLNMRIIMYDGASLPDIELLLNNLDADLILTGKVFDYQDNVATGGLPKVDFSVVLIEKTRKKVIWASKSYNSGDDAVTLFDWGTVRTAGALVSEMAQEVRKLLMAW